MTRQSRQVLLCLGLVLACCNASLPFVRVKSFGCGQRNCSAVAACGSTGLCVCPPGRGGDDCDTSTSTCAPHADNPTRHIPDVQCFRDPPCIHNDYINPARCRAWKNDGDWPTRDTSLVRPKTPWRTALQLGALLRNSTILFMGDSISEQLVNGVLCEAERTGLMLDVTFAAGSAAHAARAALEARVAAVPTNDWHDHVQTLAYAPATGTLFCFKGWARFYEKDFQAALSVAEVLVVNYGLHYNAGSAINLTMYETDMRRLVTLGAAWARASSAPPRAFLFRETSAQSFLHTGSFDVAAAAAGGNVGSRDWEYACAPPAKIDSGAVDWVDVRNGIVRRLVTALKDPKGVHVLPWQATTRARWDQLVGSRCQFKLPLLRRDKLPPGAILDTTDHKVWDEAWLPSSRSQTGHDHCSDCTHFCWTPLLYAAFVDTLAAAVERALSEH